MRPGRSASVSTIASFASALSGEYGTPPLTSSTGTESYFLSPSFSPKPNPLDVGQDLEPEETEEDDDDTPTSGPSTPRARPAVFLNTSPSPPSFQLSKAKGSFWIASSDDEEDELDTAVPPPEVFTAGPEDQFLERLSTSSRGSTPDSSIAGLADPLLELGIGIDDIVSESDSLSSEDDDLLEEEWNELEHGDDIPLTGTSIRMDEGSRPKAARRRKRRKWREAEQEFARGGHKELWQLVPPQILSYPLAFLPLLPLLPASFLPGGTAVFIPVIAVITGLSACAHVVTVYLSRYLKVTNFEDILHRSAGLYGLWIGRALQVVGILCTSVGWLRTIHPLWLTLIRPLSSSSFLASRWLVLIVSSLFILPLPARAKPHAGISLLPDLLVLLLPMVIFTVIGRAVEISKEEQGALYSAEEVPQYGPFGLERLSAGTALVTIILFNTPHVQTLPIHGSLRRTSRTWFPLPCLISAGVLLTMVLPYSLVPYYLHELHREGLGLSRAGIFSIMHRPNIVDGALNFGRFCMIALTLTTANQWVGQARAVGLRALGVEREGRAKAQRWLGFGAWLFILFFGCIGGWVADQLEILGSICILAVGWLVPAILFVKNFYLSSPLAIVFPSSGLTRISSSEPAEVHGGRASSVDVLLARKERELQKRRTGRRLWQDLIVFVGILPIGLFTVVWLLLLLLGVNI